jgi:hypothetical protein
MDEAKLAEGATRGILSFLKDIFISLWHLVKNPKKKKDFPLSDSDVKEKVNILFIDDEPFEYVDRIKDAGWNVNQIGDISNLDDEHLKRAHIVFLDYVGVGNNLSPKEQGIGLLKAIKNKYPNKIIIFYSGHAGFSLGQEFRIANDWMPKNSDPYVFLQKIEENAQKIEFK